MEDIKTFSDFLKLDNYNYFSRNKVNTLIIDKDYYELNSVNLYLLSSTNFDFSTINFDIKLNNYSSYFRLLNAYINNSIVKEKFYNYKYFDDFKIDTISEYIKILCMSINYHLILEKIINNYNINSLHISNIDSEYLTLKTIKILNYKNFNFELLRLENVVSFDISIIRYLIDNKLYDFSTKDSLTIIIHCVNNIFYDNLFEFFINYLNFDVYKLYDNKSLYYYLSEVYKLNNNSLSLKEKVKILYKKYNLIIDENELTICDNKMYEAILIFYDLKDIENFSQITLNNLLLNTYSLFRTSYGSYNLSNKYIAIFNLTNFVVLGLLVNILSSSIGMAEIDKIKIDIKELFIKVHNNNLNLDNLIKELKVQCTLAQLINFYYLYFTYYDDSISSYINNIFDCDNLDDFENLIESFEELKYTRYSIAAEGIRLISKHYIN